MPGGQALNYQQRQNASTAGTELRAGYDSQSPTGLPDHQYQGVGHTLYEFPGYGVNPARNSGADIEPIPVTPVKHQNWPEMQIQLNNGWMMTNWGVKLSYDDYLRLLTSSENQARNYLAPGPKGVAAGNQKTGPSPLNVQAWQQNGPGNQPSNPGAPGQIAQGVNLTRSYYG